MGARTAATYRHRETRRNQAALGMHSTIRYETETPSLKTGRIAHVCAPPLQGPVYLQWPSLCF